MSTHMKRTAMKRRFFKGLLATAGVGVALCAAPTANAQEIQLTGPLKGAPAVRKMRLYREGRFEVAPTVSFTLLDEYRRTILVGGRLTYNVKDWIGVGVWGAFGAIQTTTDLTDQIDTVAVRDPRTAPNLNHTASGGTAPFGDQTAKISWVAAPQITFIPFRGKLAIFQKIFVDTDFYVSPGVAFVGISERADCGGGGGQLPCADARTFSTQSRTAIAPTFGLGLSFYASNLVSIGVEYRALPFSWNRGGFDQRGGGNNNKFPDGKIDSADQTFKWNQMVTLSVGFSFPELKVSD
jgi:opacity protein-like surface antigen